MRNRSTATAGALLPPSPGALATQPVPPGAPSGDTSLLAEARREGAHRELRKLAFALEELRRTRKLMGDSAGADALREALGIVRARRNRKGPPPEVERGST